MEHCCGYTNLYPYQRMLKQLTKNNNKQKLEKTMNEKYAVCANGTNTISPLYKCLTYQNKLQ